MMTAKEEKQEIGIGVDIGGTHISAVALGRAAQTQSEVLCRSTRNVTERDVATVVSLLIECILDIDEQLRKLLGDAYDVVGIGLGVPGNVDPSVGTTRYLPNFGWLEPVPLRALLVKELSGKLNRCCAKDALTVEMRNDGRCAAIAEYTFGSGRGVQVFSMLTLGTGIGGALILNGKLFDGCSFDAGDFGHHVIRSDKDALECVCGKRGCFETQASALGLVKQFNRQPGAVECCLGLESKGHDARGVLLKLRAGEPAAVAAWDQYLDDLTTGLANLVTFYNPSVIALGGGFGQADEIYAGDAARIRIDAKSLPASRGRVRLVPAELGNGAGAIGAALLALGRGI
jgi:glucokinase